MSAPAPQATSGNSRPATPQALFDRVAPRYDRLNSLLSAGRDRAWRRAVARELSTAGPVQILDVATGTGALARTLAATVPAGSAIVGCDLNAAMLRVAAEHVATAHVATGNVDAGHDASGHVAQGPGGAPSGVPVRLVRGDGTRLPFADGWADAVTIAFAIDDMPDRERCARELRRILRPGGQLLVLELSMPETPVLRTAYTGMLSVLQLAGRLRRGEGYRHLRQEILRYRGRAAIEELLTAVGFTGYRYRPLTGGIATLHCVHKPLSPDGES